MLFMHACNADTVNSEFGKKSLNPDKQLIINSKKTATTSKSNSLDIVFDLIG